MRKGAPTPRSKTLPQPAQKVGALARLTSALAESAGYARISAPARRNPSKSAETVQRAWLMESVSWGGIGLSAVLAGVGVAGLIGFESPLAKIGSAILIGGTILTEVAAARLPVHAQKRFSEHAWVKGSLVVLGFGALTAWNVIAGHFGMVAIESASLRDQRAPLEREAAAADSAREVAEENLLAFDAESAREAETMGLALRGAFQSGYVTAAGRSARASAEARAERRGDLAQAVAVTRARDRAAERALAAAPGRRPDHELWGFALVLELLKGALVWFSTAGERRAPRPNQGPITTLSGSDPRNMSAAERRELKRWAASTLASIRHLEAARA
jgi:hypothetical protein